MQDDDEVSMNEGAPIFSYGKRERSTLRQENERSAQGNSSEFGRKNAAILKSFSEFFSYFFSTMQLLRDGLSASHYEFAEEILAQQLLNAQGILNCATEDFFHAAEAGSAGTRSADAEIRLKRTAAEQQRALHSFAFARQRLSDLLNGIIPLDLEARLAP